MSPLNYGFYFQGALPFGSEGPVFGILCAHDQGTDPHLRTWASSLHHLQLLLPIPVAWDTELGLPCLLDSDPAAQEVPPMRVLDLLQSRKDIFSIQEETTVHDAARYLRDHNVRSVGVLDGSARLVGVVSQSDISDKVAAENKCPAWMRVSEIMTRDLVVVQPEAPLDECLRLMEKHGVFHLLVTEESGRFLGMISVADL